MIETRQSVACALSPAPGRWCVVEQNFARSATLMVAIIVGFELLQWIELHISHVPRQQMLVPEASEAAMRFVTIPHFIIAFLFLVTASRNRSWQSRSRIVALLVCGAVLCGVYRYWDGAPIPGTLSSGAGGRGIVLASLVYLYFVFHELRDEAFFYRVLQAGALQDAGRFAPFAGALSVLATGGLLVILWPVVVFGWPGKVIPMVATDSTFLARIGLALGPAALWPVAAYGLLRWQADGASEPIVDALRRHATLLRVFAGVFLVLALGFMTVRRPYPIVLLHVTVWYVFICHTMKVRPPDPSSQWWTWLRTTTTGFRALHIGLVLVLLAAGTICLRAFGQLGPLWYVLSPEVFVYWTIMHITVSFVPR